MIRTADKRNLIYKELDEENRKYWFDISEEKVLHNIDSLYFNIYVQEPVLDKSFVALLDSLKDMAELEPYYVSEWDVQVHKYAIKGFDFALEKADNFHIFFKRSRKGSSFPVCRVQLSSALLWEVGEYEAIKKGYEYALRIMDGYYTPMDIKETRIDYAYHTNYLRNIGKFVNAENINKVQVSRFKKAFIVADLSVDDEMALETVCLGSRSSKSVYVRIYDKTREVIENGYKAFFYPIWLENKLISKYDLYCYEIAYKKRSMKWLTMARLEFYLEHGSDANLKSRCNNILSEYEKLERVDLERFANSITPKPTMIVNIEFETGVNFYDSLKDEILLLPLHTKIDNFAFSRVFRLLDHKASILSLLNSNVFRIVDINDTVHKRKREKDLHPLWKKIQELKIESKSKEVALIRKYNRSLNAEALRGRIVNAISTLSFYENDDNDYNLFDDTCDFMSSISENEVKKALYYKRKKANQLRNRFNQENAALNKSSNVNSPL